MTKKLLLDGNRTTVSIRRQTHKMAMDYCRLKGFVFHRWIGDVIAMEIERQEQKEPASVSQ